MNIPRTDITELIGRKFKRNVYGLSIWTDEITYVGHRYQILSYDKETRETTRAIKMFVVGSRSDQWYDLDEIVLVDKPLKDIEFLQLNKKEFHEKIRKNESD